MPTEAKERMVAELTEVFSASPSSIVADYRGLTVADLSVLRRRLREEGISYRVVKNRLGKIAARRAGLEELEPLLEGPSAIVLGAVDESLLAKTFLEAIRPYRTIVVRGGILRGRRVSASDVTRLSALPPRDVLLGQLAGGIASPLSTMAGLLNAPLRNLAYALAQLAEQRGAGADPSTESA